MILAVTLRGSKRRPRSKRPDILGFAVEQEEGRLRVPLLLVTRGSRARSVHAHLIDGEARSRVRVAWPLLAPGAHQNVTLEVL